MIGFYATDRLVVNGSCTCSRQSDLAIINPTLKASDLVSDGHGQGQSRRFHVRQAFRPKTAADISDVRNDSGSYPNNLCLTNPYQSSQLEGTRPRKSVSDVLENPELRFHGAQSSYGSPP